MSQSKIERIIQAKINFGHRLTKAESDYLARHPTRFKRIRRLKKPAARPPGSSVLDTLGASFRNFGRGMSGNLNPADVE